MRAGGFSAIVDLFRRYHHLFFWGFLLIGPTGVASYVKAETLRDAVKDHLRENLEKPRAQAKEKKRSTKRSEPNQPVQPQTGESTAEQERVAAAVDEKAEQEAPKLPLRLIGSDLELDLLVGGGYRGWVPQQYPTVAVDMASYFTWNVEVKAKIFRWLNLRRGYYESSGLSGPRTSGAAVAAQVGSYVPKAAWLMGMLGFPFLQVWEPIIRYETRAFQTRAKPKGKVCIVKKDQTGDLENCPMTDQPLRIVSGFETLVAGVRYNHDKNSSPVIHTPKGKIPPIFFGIGLMSYSKPYQVTVNGDVLNEYLFDGRFLGGGLAAGTDLGGGIDRFFADVYLQAGLGQIKLTSKLTLNELAPKGWLIGYVQGDVALGYRWPVWRFAPTLMFVPELTGGGAAFFFFKPWIKKDEEASTPGINWDFLWTARGSLVLSL
jgi:hypothetical protein